MPKVYRLRKGLTINLKGEAAKEIAGKQYSTLVSIKPPDFYGIVPKLLVKVGEKLQAGSPVFYGKKHPEVVVTSPVSGVVKHIFRGERRRILEIVIEADEIISYKKFKIADPLSLTAKEIKGLLLQSGLWPGIKQRPYDIITQPDIPPKAIFISAFETSPLAPDVGFVLQQNEIEFQTGLDALSKLTNGSINLNLKHKSFYSNAIKNAKNVTINYFSGKHPAGNVGIQINKLAPVNKGETIWCIDPFHVVIIGKLFLKGVYDAEKIIALAGTGVKSPKYHRCLIGENVSTLLANNLKKNKPYRIISGNVFTGTAVEKDGYLGYYDSQITVIPEGKNYEFLGWIMPGLEKFSHSKTFFSWLMPKKKYDLTTKMHGDKRAFVFSGQYEKVFPMDIHPVFLLKAMLAEDIDKMEQLGIYEVSPEDFASCEFVCSSKINVQKIVRNGLDLMIEEME